MTISNSGHARIRAANNELFNATARLDEVLQNYGALGKSAERTFLKELGAFARKLRELQLTVGEELEGSK